MEEYKKYNRHEMEERLPAYIFGELSELEKDIFDKSLADFPDIHDEIKQVRNTFVLLDKIDYDKLLFDKTKDIPSRVARQVAKNNTQKKLSFLPLRFLVPALITAGILFIVVKAGFMDNYWNDVKPKTYNQISKNSKIDDAVNDILMDDEVQNEIAQSSDYDNAQITIIEEGDFEQNIENYYQQFMFGVHSYTNTSNSPNVESYLTLNTNIENIDEEIFEQIIEEIKNANLQF